MFKRIFRAIFASTTLVLLVSVALSALSLSIDFDNTEVRTLTSQAGLVAAGVNAGGVKYLKELRGENYRVTWIDQNGKVLFDNEENPKKMGNHAQRKEVAEAMKKGTGESERFSTTLSTVTHYYAERLKDGSVIRVAITRNTMLLALLHLISPLLIILLGATAISWLLAKKISETIVEPLNSLDLDHPLESSSYEEIKPLLSRLDSQNKQDRKSVV